MSMTKINFNKLSQEEIEDLYKKAKKAYYSSSRPIMSDTLFDKLEDYIKNKYPTSKVLKLIGYEIEKNKVRLPFYMGSLDKIKPEEKNVNPWLDNHKGPYVVSDKLDGISIGIEIKEGKIKAYSRGKASVGHDISHLIPFLKLPKNIDLKTPLSIRGEILISKSKFKSLKDKFENPRNLTSGIVNSKKIPKIANKLALRIYEVISPRGVPSRQLTNLKNKGFKVAPFKVFDSLDEITLIDYLKTRKKKSKFDIDGLVICQDKKNPVNNSGNPKYAIAFKTTSKDEIAKTKVLRVKWQVSKHGFLKPVIKVKPTRLMGVTINNVTGNNAKFIVDNKIGKNTIIKIIRSGDVIPKVYEVIKSTTPDLHDTKKYKYKWNSSKVELVLNKPSSNETVAIKRIVSFFTTIQVENFNIGLTTKLYQNGFTTIKDIINAKPSDFNKIEGFKNTLSTKIYSNIQRKLKEADNVLLASGSGKFGMGLGERKLRVIEKVYPGFKELKNLSEKEVIERVSKLEGFSNITSTYFAKGLPKYFKWLKKLGLKPNVKNKTPKSRKLENHIVVFTGVRDKSLEKEIINNGGVIGSSVSRNTTDLIYASKTSDKYKKAIELKIPTYSISEFKKKYNI